MEKPGYKTTEFWLAGLTNFALAIVGLVAGYGYLTSEQADLWNGLVVTAVPLGMAGVSWAYSQSRARVKTGN